MTDNAEADPPKELRYRGGLDRCPGIASAIGAYVGEFAILETFLEIIFDAVTQAAVPQDQHCNFGRAVLGHIQSFALRCDLLASVLEASKLNGTEHGNRMSSFIKEARTINARRNVYVHGTYTYEPAQKRVLLHFWATSQGKKQATEELSATKVLEDMAAIRALLGTLAPPDLAAPPPEQVPSP